jgi:hypothetical protein
MSTRRDGRWLRGEEMPVQTIANIEELTVEILERADRISSLIPNLTDATAALWATALGLVHEAESRLWKLERSMLDTARDRLDRREPPPDDTA